MLEDIIKAEIDKKDIISVDQFMEYALFHPDYGYYTKKDPIGRAGDFTTAPEISQIFGELIGAWLAYCWQEMGAPPDTKLIELGPGHGTLMHDILRATRNIPSFHDSIRVCMVETSPTLRRLQQQKLQYSHPLIKWFDDINNIEESPSLIVANELFDALPTKQFVKTGQIYKERGVIYNKDGFAFSLYNEPVADKRIEKLLAQEPYCHLSESSIVEISLASIDMMRSLSKRMLSHKGVGLLIDYGYALNPAMKKTSETLQAVRQHQFSNVLEHVGECDLTTHVNFSLLATIAEQEGAKSSPSLEQGTFLKAMGIDIRGEILCKNLLEETQKDDIIKGIYRLTDPSEMGNIFKAMSFYSPILPMPTIFREFFHDC